MNKDLRIVAIGASTGGIEAITDFFEHLPDRTGVAFVIIQHLGPDVKSIKDQLLSKYTQMPIQLITGETAVQPDHVYILSKDKPIYIENGIIKEVIDAENTHIKTPIDTFFHSLGKDLGDKAAAVVLSGSGRDGCSGIVTIHKVGGLVYVQEPSTAKFDGMPQAAIATGVADGIYPPVELPNEIVRHIQQLMSSPNSAVNINSPDELELFNRTLRKVEKATGLNFLDYRKTTLARRIERRMAKLQIEDLGQYYEYLSVTDEEPRILMDEFLIGLTRFFRDPEAFNQLKKQVIPALIKNISPGEQLRIWVAGCSTGEEAYSIAILIQEYLEENQLDHPFKIFATDINPQAIAVASAGIFSKLAAAEVPRQLLERYFDKVQDHYSIKQNVREHLVFTIHDTLRNPPFINIDLLSCRNMLIYFNSVAQKTALRNFQYALKPGGFLFIGLSESITPIKNALGIISNTWNIYSKLNSNQPSPALSRQPGSLHRGMDRQKKLQRRFSIEAAKLQSGDLFARKIADRFGPLSLFVDQQFNIIYINGDFNEILHFPRNFATWNLLETLGENETLVFRQGIKKALKSDIEIVIRDFLLSWRDRTHLIDLRFCQFRDSKFSEPLIWIMFSIKNLEEKTERKEKEIMQIERHETEKLLTLEQELRQLNAEKQILVDQLESANEELQTSNEELLTANEELQSTNQELQSVNEELYTVNMELQGKINELILSNNDINNLLKSTEIGTIFLDIQLKIRKFTPAIKDQFNLEDADIGRPISDFTNSFKDENIYQEIAEVLITRQQTEREIKDKNGNFYLMRILPYKTENGQVDGVVITFIDINDLRMAQIEVEKNMLVYEGIFRNTKDLVASVDTRGIVKRVNFNNFEGFDDVEIIGNPVWNFVLPELRDNFKEAFHKALEGKSHQNTQVLTRIPGGKEMWFSVVFTPVSIKGETNEMILLARDITELKNSEQDLKQLSLDLEKQITQRNKVLEATNKELKSINDYLDSFVHGAAHDLRSPIVQMKGLLKLLPNSKSDKQRATIIHKVEESVNHMDNTLNGLIELVEFQKNSDKLINVFDLVNIYEDVAKQLEYDLQKADAIITTDFGTQTKIYYIQAYLKSIFYNLLSNAIKYRSYNRPLEIQLSIKKQRKFMLITIEDNGIGIDLNRYGHFLFEPFKRLTVERNGTGIGLSIINNAIKKNGGKIEVESQPGKGTKFKVYLVPYQKKAALTKPVKNAGNSKV